MGLTAAYVAGFATYIAFLVFERYLPFQTHVAYGIRILTVAAVTLIFSRKVISLRCSHPLGSILLGIAVCVIWVGPDFLWPSYRQHGLFQNPLTGSATSSIDPALKSNTAFIAMRITGSALLVPIIEELFWRAWLMRVFIDTNFSKIPLGAYSAQSFWLVALLFASEHGPYWEVGLLAGIAYNWWMIRTRSLGDCILAHAVTNAGLAVWVLKADQWQYWL